MSWRQIWGSEMGKPHPVELRERAVRLVEQGHTHTETARRLCVSIKSVNDMVRLRRETGSLAPKRQSNPGRGKLTGVTDWVQRRITAQPDLTIDELTAELASDHGLAVHPGTHPCHSLCRRSGLWDSTSLVVSYDVYHSADDTPVVHTVSTWDRGK